MILAVKLFYFISDVVPC